MRSFILLPLMALLGACATPDGLDVPTQQRLSQKWLGRPIESRVAAVGNPDDVQDRLDGKSGKVYRWKFDTGYAVPPSTTYNRSTAWTGNQVTTANVPGIRQGYYVPGSCLVEVWADERGIIDNLITRGDCG